MRVQICIKLSAAVDELLTVH